MIAALFVELGGVYFGLPNVTPWDERRDARKYDGPHPVVAHPPCHLWTNFARVNFKRYGGEHNRPGNDGGCFEAALRSVRRFGGVLEHPAESHAWERFGLQTPEKKGGWQIVIPVSAGLVSGGPSAYVCEVWQSAYGHKARKRTWLYYVGRTPVALDWTQKEGTHQCGWFDRKKPTLSKKEASRTPVAFRDVLIRLAEHAR